MPGSQPGQLGPQSGTPDPHEPLLNIENETVRERVRVSIGGSQIRLRFSNEFGSSPLLIGAATVAIPTDVEYQRRIDSERYAWRTQVYRDSSWSTCPCDPISFPLTPGAELSITDLSQPE